MFGRVCLSPSSFVGFLEKVAHFFAITIKKVPHFFVIMIEKVPHFLYIIVMERSDGYG